MTSRSHTLIVGVLNVTPDSFSDAGRFFANVEIAVAEGLAMAAAGADWIDVGGESTRPGAEPVSGPDERARVVPVLKALAERLSGKARLCIDTYKAETAREAIAAGATVVNDVSGGLLDPAILEETARAGAAYVVGHMRGDPRSTNAHISFRDVVAEVGDELAARIDAVRSAGCREIWADPGIGFGKTTDHNLALLAALPALRARLGVPLYVGVSRKRFIGELTGQPVDKRSFGTAAAVTAAILGGAEAVRVHDVAHMRDAARVADGIRAAASPSQK